VPSAAALAWHGGAQSDLNHSYQVTGCGFATKCAVKGTGIGGAPNGRPQWAQRGSKPATIVAWVARRKAPIGGAACEAPSGMAVEAESSSCVRASRRRRQAGGLAGPGQSARCAIAACCRTQPHLDSARDLAEHLPALRHRSHGLQEWVEWGGRAG
jgi:hypothetical protein